MKTKVMGKKIVQYWMVKSQNGNKEYKVCELEDGSFSCSCPVWIYRRQECKHIEQVKRQKRLKINSGNTVFEDIWILQPINSNRVKLLKKEIDKKEKKCYHYVGVPLIGIDPLDWKSVQRYYAQMRNLGVPKKVIKEYWRFL